MTEDRYRKGLATIRSAALQSLQDRSVKGAAVSLSESNASERPVELSISVNGKTQVQVFTYRELEDSSEAIDAPAALKVRLLVSHFIGA